MKVQPIGNKILVTPDRPADRSKGGVYLPDNPRRKTQQGRVKAIGTGRVADDGRVIPMSVAVGDVVVFRQHSEQKAEDYLSEDIIITDDDVLARIEK